MFMDERLNMSIKCSKSFFGFMLFHEILQNFPEMNAYTIVSKRQSLEFQEILLSISK